MKKKILFAIAFFTIALSFLVFAACKEEKITINVPEDGYKAIIGRTVKLEIETDSKKIPVFLIIKGEEYVDWITNDGELKVISGGKELVGKTINLIASIGKSKSNEVIITITDIALTAITDLSIPFAYVLPGENVEISYELYPQNTTQDDITFEIVSGSGAIIEGNILKVSFNAEQGIITVRARRGDIISETIEIEIRRPGIFDYEISGENEINVYSGSQNKTSIRVTDRAGNPIDNAVVFFSIVSGNENINIIENGYNLTIDVIGHGKAEILAELENGKTHTIIVNSIKTPSKLELPDYLKDLTEYTVSVNQPFDFEVTIPDDSYNKSACKDIVYQFISLDDNQTENVGIYKDGKITFFKTGRIKVIATSNSGNINGEVSVSFIFNVILG